MKKKYRHGRNTVETHPKKEKKRKDHEEKIEKHGRNTVETHPKEGGKRKDHEENQETR